MGERSYFKRIQNEVGSSTNRKREEKKNSSNEYRDPFATKVIKNLIKTEQELQKKILRIKENEKLFKSQSYLKLFNKNPINLNKDKEIIKSKVNDLSKSKSIIISRADYINSEIYNLQNKNDKQTGDFKNKILQNMYKLNQNLMSFKEKNQSNKSSDNAYENKLVKLLDAKEEEKFMEEQKLLALKHKREIEREDIKKRQEKNHEELLKLLKFRNVRPKKEYYLYEKIYNNYLDREDNLIKKENAKRRAKMKHIDSQEFLEMEKSYQERKVQLEENNKETKKALKKEWNERQKLIPNYINPFIKIINEEQEKIEQEKELKIQKIIQHKNNMINFSNKLRNPKKWKEKNEYNYLLEKEKMEQKLKIFNQSLASKNEYSDRIRNKIMKKNKKSKEKKESIIEDKNGDIKNYKDITIIKPSSGKINKRKNFVTKDDKGNIIHSVHNIKDEQNLCNKKDKIRDYLAEKRKKEKPKLNNIYANDIKNFLKKCGITENSLFMTKCKLDVLKEKKNQKNFFLKQNGGIAKNPEVGEELFNLSLNIIRGKLAIIEELEKKFDKESYGTNEEQDSEKESENETENKLEPKYKDGKESSV